MAVLCYPPRMANDIPAAVLAELQLALSRNLQYHPANRAHLGINVTRTALGERSIEGIPLAEIYRYCYYYYYY